MNERIEGLLVDWGEQRRRRGLMGTGVSPLAGLIEWCGAPPRGEPSSVILTGGAGMGYAASQVDGALAAMERRGALLDEQSNASPCLDSLLVQLAYARYLRQKPLSEQLVAARCGKSVYYERLDALHAAVERELKVRLKRSA